MNGQGQGFGQAIISFFSGAIGAVIGLAMAAAGLTFFVILWKSGSLPVVLGWVPALLGLVREGIGGFFGFLTTLVRAVL